MDEQERERLLALQELDRSERLLRTGQNWSSIAGTVGIGGVGRSVTLGELSLDERHPQQATLTLGLVNLQPQNTLGRGRVYAVVKYGIGLANLTVVLDWGPTTSICLPCGKVNVTAVEVDAKGAPVLPMPAGYEIPDPTENIAVPIILTAELAAGPRSSIAMPTLSQTINLLGGVAVPWHVPARGKRVLVGDARGQLGTDLTALVVGSLAQNFYSLANAADSLIRTEGVALQGGADNVQLTSAGGWNGATLCWFLDG